MRHADALGEPRMMNQMSQRAMHRDKEFRARDVDHQLQFFFACVTGDMNVGCFMRDDFGAASIEVVDDMRHGAFVARNRARGNHDDVALLDRDLFVFADSHARQRRRRLALCSRRHDHQLVRLFGARRAHFAGESDVAEALGGFDVVDERAAHHHHFAFRFARGVDHLLHAMNVRGEAGDDDPALDPAEHLLELASDAAF